MKIQKISQLILDAIFEVSEYAEDQIQSTYTDNVGDLFLVDIGINSISYAEIATIINFKIGVDIPLEQYSKINKIKDVEELIHRALVANDSNLAV